MVWEIGKPIPAIHFERREIDIKKYPPERMAIVSGRIYETSSRIEKTVGMTLAEFLGLIQPPTEAEIGRRFIDNIHKIATERRAAARVYWVRVERDTITAQWSIIGTPPIPIALIAKMVLGIVVLGVAVTIYFIITRVIELITKLIPPGALQILGWAIALGLMVLIGRFIWRIIKPVAPPPPQKR